MICCKITFNTYRHEGVFVLSFKHMQIQQKDDLTLRHREILKIMTTLGECTTSQILENMKRHRQLIDPDLI